MDGNILKVYNNITNKDGILLTDINESSILNSDFIIKAYGGKVNDTMFNGEYYGYHLKEDDTKINLNSNFNILLLLSTKIRCWK